MPPAPAASEEECTGVARVVQDLDGVGVREREPGEFPAVWPLADVARHQDILSAEDLRDPERRPDATEGLARRKHRPPVSPRGHTRGAGDTPGRGREVRLLASGRALSEGRGPHRRRLGAGLSTIAARSLAAGEARHRLSQCYETDPPGFRCDARI